MRRAESYRVCIGVIGGGECSGEGMRLAEEVGRLLAQRGAVVVTGGLGGVMDAASRGAKSADGLTVGILPGSSAADANPHVDVAIVTAMSVARNAIVVRSSRALIAIEGSYGTLSEIALALNIGVPVVSLNAWPSIPGVVAAASAADAVDKALELARRDETFTD